MSTRRNIYLIGPRASGKTSVGRDLAAHLGREFLDTDRVVVKALDMDIAGYVGENGWEAFRDREVEALAQAAETGNRVVGCGGGIVLRSENRAVLATGVTFYLKVDPNELAKRLSADPMEAQRPALTSLSPAEEIRKVLAQREHLYEECADFVIAGKSLGETVQAILQALETLDGSF